MSGVSGGNKIGTRTPLHECRHESSEESRVNREVLGRGHPTSTPTWTCNEAVLEQGTWCPAWFGFCCVKTAVRTKLIATRNAHLISASCGGGVLDILESLRCWVVHRDPGCGLAWCGYANERNKCARSHAFKNVSTCRHCNTSVTICTFLYTRFHHRWFMFWVDMHELSRGLRRTHHFESYGIDSYLDWLANQMNRGDES